MGCKFVVTNLSKTLDRLAWVYIMRTFSTRRKQRNDGKGARNKGLTKI